MQTDREDKWGGKKNNFFVALCILWLSPFLLTSLTSKLLLGTLSYCIMVTVCLLVVDNKYVLVDGKKSSALDQVQDCFYVPHFIFFKLSPEEQKDGVT